MHEPFNIVIRGRDIQKAKREREINKSKAQIDGYSKDTGSN